MGSQGLEQHQSVLRERFYQSVAETLTLLHTAPGHDRGQALLDVAKTLASTMDLPLVWIGRREMGQSRLHITAAGPEADYATSLRLSDDSYEPGGRGPAGMVLREGRARLTTMEAPECAPWQDAARRHGLGSTIVAASGTADEGQLALAVYSRNSGPALTVELLDWAQRLADELARFWDDQALLERNLRLSCYRDAHRRIQRAMLAQPAPEAIYQGLAETLVEVAGAAAVIILVPEGEMLHRAVAVGPVADAIISQPEPPTHVESRPIRTPTLAYMRGAPIVRLQPSTHPDVSDAWRTEPLARMTAVGCWPVFSSPAVDAEMARTVDALLVLVTAESAPFDVDMRELLDEIVDTVGLALRQHRDRQALLKEQERQTYLALHDSLTGLPNRRALDHQLERALVRAARHQRLVAVGMLDLDDLKPINDRYGHLVGDRLLIELATRLSESLRSEDYVARLGGDEFVLVFEDLAAEDDLDVLLDRLWQSLQQPILAGDAAIQITVSLGVALYPSHGPASGEQLLRLADQAMYQVKSGKQPRSSWWALAVPEGVAEEPAEADAGGDDPHGAHAAAVLRPCIDAWQVQLPVVVERFSAAIRLHKGIVGVLDCFPPDAMKAFKSRLTRQLQTLFYPDLDLDSQREGAFRAGHCQAACGLEEVWLIEAAEQLRELLAGTLGAGTRSRRHALAIVLQRLALELQWQRESMAELQRRRDAKLARVRGMAWSARNYLQLIEGVVTVLASSEEVVACAAVRPDASGVMVHEIVAGAVPVEQLRITNSGSAPVLVIHTESSGEEEPVARAWYTAGIQRCAHHGSDPAMLLWRDTAVRHGVVSHVAIPLCLPVGKPFAILALYSPYAGGFRSKSQQAFVEQIKAVMELALLHMAPRRQLAALLPAFVRQRWRIIIAGGALRMHYQPLIRLADRQLAGFEALARLRDDAGSLQLPASFLPALGAAGLMRLFRDGVIQAVAFRQSLARRGFALGMSVNVPEVAVQDARYARTVETVLQVSGCPIGALRFEALESHDGTGPWALMASTGVQSLKSLDASAGGDEMTLSRRLLARLGQSTYDRIKIDPAIITQVRQDPLGTLRLLRQLIRVGHDLGQEVVVEGLESTGMIEAVTLLGADFGQGFALAHPMPPDALQGWLDDFEPEGHNPFPSSALGALAATLRWEERFVELFDEPYSRARHVQASSTVAQYVHRGEAVLAPLRASHDAMRKAALAGPFDRDYALRRDEFFSLLVELALTEECRLERKAPDPA